MTRKLRVGLIFGGRSGEHEVSLWSAQSVMAAIDKSKYEVVPIGITREGKWLVSGDPMKMLREGSTDDPSARPAEPSLLIPARGEAASDAHLDVVFPLLHGPHGEDGTVQGLLELTDLPYVGAGVLASALGMDKALMKTVFRQRGLPVVDFLIVKRRDWETDPAVVTRQVEEEIGYPCFVKPANLGSSVGVSQVRNRDGLGPALALATAYDRKLLVERAAVDCREIECSVLGNDDPIASVLGEVIPKGEFYDYEAKYFDHGTELVVPADLPRDTTKEVQRLAVEAFLAIDGAGMARVDFFVGRKDYRIYINEINTIPGFTAVSMYPKLWEASGLPYSQLIDRLIQLALERHADKSRSRWKR